MRGKARGADRTGGGGRDHPRVCGEKPCQFVHTLIHRGSPPRMRGKGLSFLFSFQPVGITPAYAGKSGTCLDSIDADRDHPRVCGEKRSLARCRAYLAGSPPRMRGKA